jgi:cytochrome c
MSRFAVPLISTTLVALILAGVAAQGQLRGHGGPVRAVAVSRDGRTALSGSFDQAAIVWSLQHDAATKVLRFHDSAVNAVAFLPDSRAVTAGEDGRIAIWRDGADEPERVLEGHTAPVVSLAVAPDGRIASASWDQTVRIWAADGTSRVLEGHQQNVNGVAFAPDATSVVSAGYDATVRTWPLAAASSPGIITLPSPLNAVAIAPDGEIIAGGADGIVRFIARDGGAVSGEVSAGPSPVIALAVSPDGALVAAAGIRGAVAIIERQSRKLARTLVGPGLPVWSLAFFPDGRHLLTGGTDRMVRRWDAASGDHIGAVAMGGPEDPLAKYAGDRGAEVFRACVACHTLSPDEGNRAGPTLSGLFGRRIATLPGYRYSAALRRLDIIWTPDTVAKLFEVGPATYTPGTRMPEQRIGAAEDREALVRFLERATKPR